MDEHASTQRSFWRRHGLKFPGSVSIAPNNNPSSQDTSSTTEPKVVGARYNYTSLVTTQRSTSQQPHINDTIKTAAPMLPSQYPTSSHSLSFSSKKKKKSREALSASGSTAVHQRSTSSPHKSFDAFLKDTNDEWSDELGYENIPKGASSTTHVTTIHSPSSSSSSSTTTPQLKASSPLSSPPLPSTSPFSSSHPLPSTSPSHKAVVSPPTIQKSSSLPAGGIKADIEQRIEDPTNIIKNIDPDITRDPAKTKKFKDILSQPNVDLAALKRISWSGIPREYRLVAWQLLLGYLPCNSARRVTALAQKRKEYSDSVAASYSRGTAGLDQALWHQIHIDIPRTNPGVPLYQYEATQLCLERILYQWAIRHPASGYVQGINDLVTPIFEVFLSAYIDDNPEDYDVSQLDSTVLSVIEADSFWCLSKLLDGIQDNYTFAQPGIQRQVATLKDLVSRIDARLANHLQQEGIQFIQFAFRWMNCLLMREMPLKCTVRMWDTYLAEGSSEGFSEFHVYVCAAFLVKWSEQLQAQDFQGIMIFLQQLPTQDWNEKDVELLLSEAYMWKTLFHNAPSHLK
ncbi:rab-GTPase-TBC domain-containing protein [Phascolomyces articulosus]|uniref:Rab-GTPase-TBC domain-containing protein n=1 Tax=Phascolomyces articulosus TaxID=60185 RepID=A0AAD5JTJ9_9FUNG|nr:rab-GTPase-TBC domain-containing protein [Phascolomyces articulosus]